jgi:hypothetical protein
MSLGCTTSRGDKEMTKTVTHSRILSILAVPVFVRVAGLGLVS